MREMKEGCEESGCQGNGMSGKRGSSTRSTSCGSRCHPFSRITGNSCFHHALLSRERDCANLVHSTKTMPEQVSQPRETQKMGRSSDSGLIPKICGSAACSRTSIMILISCTSIRDRPHAYPSFSIRSEFRSFSHATQQLAFHPRLVFALQKRSLTHVPACLRQCASRSQQVDLCHNRAAYSASRSLIRAAAKDDCWRILLNACYGA